MKAKSFFTLFFLACYSFFNPFGLVKGDVAKIVWYFAVAMGFLYCFNHNLRIKISYPKKSYTLLFIGFFLSLISVILFQKQSIPTSIISELPFLTAYSTFLIFLKLNIPRDYILKVLRCVMIVCIVGNILNRLTFPLLVFGNSINGEGDIGRGFLRLPIVGMDIMIFFWFYFINKITYRTNKNYLGWLSVIFFMIVLSLTRQVILWSLVLGGLLYVQKIPGAKKIFAMIAILFVGFIIIPNTSVYKNLEQSTEREAKSTGGLENNVRVKATLFYLTEFQTNNITYLIGNGVPALQKSEWGRKVDNETNWYKSHTGYQTGDVGWAGFFWYFGAISTIALLSLVFCALFKKKTKATKYINYWLIYFILTAFTSAPNLYWWQIAFFCLVLYLTYANGNNNIRVQQRSRHNQLLTQPA